MNRLIQWAFVVILAPLVGFLGARSSAAGDVDPLLANHLSQVAPTEKVTVFVYLDRQVDLAATTKWLDAMDATRRHRHEVVVRSLRELAGRTQPPVVQQIRALERGGRAANLVAFWIFNGFAVDLTASAVRELSWRSDVGTIFWAGSSERATDDLIRPVEIVPSTPTKPFDAPESGLLECKADFLWNLGINGKGRVVANIDTGVDGNHNALKAQWRGTLPGVTPGEAWHDATGNTTFPGPTRGSHGTHVMGTICGDDGGSNRVGMAWGAHWIASNAINAPFPRAQRNVIYNAAIQWCADPDGDPSTVDDVPDACGNSWGVRDPNNGVPPCSPVFNAAIDAAEAATVVFVFAAGNEGTRGPRVPADRITSDTNTFSIGSLNTGSQTISSFSSRGPSPCDNQTIKPEVCARGSSVRSSVPGNGYSSFSGTSMATPHVTGAVALLRQVYPEVTVDRVKKILMETADDLGSNGEDNTYGWGRINCQTAYAKLLGERPSVAGRVQGTKQTWKEGSTWAARVSISSYAKTQQTVNVAIQFYLNNNPTSLIILPPVDVPIPAGYTSEAAPLLVKLPIPSGLPAAFLAPNQWSLRITIRQQGAGPLIHQSDYGYTITP